MNKYQLAELERQRNMLYEFFIITIAAYVILNADRIDSFFTWVASEVVKWFVL
jgi:hypothetical protein